MLKTHELVYSYGGSELLKFPDIECKTGEHWLLLGQSGTGKTTLLHLLGGLRSPIHGYVEVAGTVLSHLGPKAQDRFRGQNIGIIFQQAHFVKSLTVGENLALAQKLANLPIRQERIKELLDRLNIGNKLNKKTNSLSQGEQQRVAIARALVNKPKVILADEPTSALDDLNTEKVIALLEEQAKADNATLLVVTHDGRLKSHFPNQIHL